MNPIEAQEISLLPPKYRPLGMWGYFGYSILFAIPVVGLVCAIVFSFSDANIARRNFARSYFCLLIIGVVICIVAVAVGAVSYLFAPVEGAAPVGGQFA